MGVLEHGVEGQEGAGRDDVVGGVVGVRSGVDADGVAVRALPGLICNEGTSFT